MKQIKVFGYTPSELKKFWVSALGFALTVIAFLLQGGLIPESWMPWILVLIGVCGSYGVFKVQNGTPTKPVS